MSIVRLSTAIALGLCLAGGASATQSGVPDQRSARAHADARRSLDGGDLKAAQIHLRNAVRHDPGNLEARYDLGIVNLRLGDLPAAEKDLQQALAGGFAPDRALPEYGAVLLQLQKFDKLLAEIRPGDRAPQLEAKLRVLRAAAQTGLRRPDAAERELRESLAIQPAAAAHVGLDGEGFA